MNVARFFRNALDLMSLTKKVQPEPANSDTPRRIFPQAQYNEDIARDGVVVFPWLTVAQVTQLADIIRDLGQGVDFDDVHIPSNFRLSAFNNNSVYKAALYEAVSGFMAGKLDELLPGYVPLVINVFDKQASTADDAVPMHQNPSFVMEPEHKSVSIWIPLQPVSRENGTLGVLKGSHNKFNHMRASNMRHGHIFAKVSSVLEQRFCEPLDLDVGEVAVLDDSVIHWSYPNNSGQVRTAVQLIMVPRAAQHIYFYYNESGPRPVMDMYEVDKNFFFEFNCKALPEGLKRIGSVPYRYAQITERQLR